MPTASGTPPLALRAGSAPLIGRTQQLAVLVEHLAEARRLENPRRSDVVLLAGPPGIGKTRLLEEFPPPDLADDMVILRGGASQAAGMPPYLPFLHALSDYIAAAPVDQLCGQLGPHAPTLATVFPEIPARLRPIPPLHVLGAEQERFRLYEAVVAFLAAIASPGPLALLLDDLQWADAASCDLLVHVASRLRSKPVLIVGAYRNSETTENPTLVPTLAELNRRRLLHTLPLHPFEVEESRALAVNLVHGPIAPNVADILHRQGEGNPFFLEELLRALLEEGVLIWQDGRWELVSPPGRLLPPRVVEAIQMRLARLDPQVVELLRVAAVVGRACEPSLLAQVVQLDVEQVEALLLAAARAQIVRPEADGSYAFTHDLVRETLYAEVGSVRRRRLHQAIGEALDAQGGTDSPQQLADLAFHFAEAGETARGVTYALACGERALRASAAVEAMGYYRTALGLLGSSGEIGHRAVALMGLGNAAVLAGDYDQAVEAYQAAGEIWLRSDTTTAAQAWRRLGQVWWRQEAVVAAREAFERSLVLLGPDDSPDAAETLLQLADLHATSLGRNTEGIAYAERALAMVARLGDRRLEAEAWCVAGNVKARSNDLVAGQKLLERALALAQELDDPALGAEACAYLANVYAWIGDLDRSRELSILRAEYAQRTHDLFHLRHVYSWIGQLETLRGRWANAEQWFRQQEQVLAALQSPEPHAALHAYRGALRYLQGRFGAADQEFRQVVELLQPTGSGTLVWYLGWRGLVLAELGQRDAALACYTELFSLADALDERARGRGFAFAHLAVGYARLAEWSRAAGCYPKLLPFRGQFAPILIDRGLGLAALARGDSQSARRHLADAEVQARRIGVLPELALTLVQRGLLERRSRQSKTAPFTPAHDYLAEGLRFCAELGMQELGQRMLSPPPAKPTRRRDRGTQDSTDVAGLSNRELEVLGLVAQGKTNREIAKILILSEKTVARHLTNIFTKTGVDNRAGAVAFALRHGLA
jgi:DNA-binding CsgD family transcriptional regulator/tetratricopeptide (TPR) repeat protein